MLDKFNIYNNDDDNLSTDQYDLKEMYDSIFRLFLDAYEGTEILKNLSLVHFGNEGNELLFHYALKDFNTNNNPYSNDIIVNNIGHVNEIFKRFKNCYNESVFEDRMEKLKELIKCKKISKELFEKLVDSIILGNDVFGFPKHKLELYSSYKCYCNVVENNVEQNYLSPLADIVVNVIREIMDTVGTPTLYNSIVSQVEDAYKEELDVMLVF